MGQVDLPRHAVSIQTHITLISHELGHLKIYQSLYIYTLFMSVKWSTIFADFPIFFYYYIVGDIFLLYPHCIPNYPLQSHNQIVGYIPMIFQWKFPMPYPKIAGETSISGMHLSYLCLFVGYCWFIDCDYHYITIDYPSKNY